MSNYPPGAKDDPRAPYNEPLNKDVEFSINVVCDTYKTVSIPENTFDYEDIKDNLKRSIVKTLEDNDFSVHEVIIIPE